MKILVGLSGGVDSAVAAYLLKQDGWQVAGAFMRNWDAAANNDVLGNPTVNDPVCPQEQDYRDAEAVARQLDIPLARIDFIREYWDEVFASFLREYEKGRTPNPDILCNKYIKFDAFFDFARANGYDRVATGHYAMVSHDADGSRLYKALDRNKDQSYFLDQVDRKALDRTEFPLARLSKPEVRQIAEDLGLAVAEKKDSTGICFIGERHFRQFLNNYLPARPGAMIDLTTGETVGTHTGVLYYTIGQRKGLGIGGDQGRWFVVGKDVRRNELYVVPEAGKRWLASDSCLVSQVNWLDAVSLPLDAAAKFRYRQNDNPVTIEAYDETTLLVRYPQGVDAVTPGQQAVFYRGDQCLGGGVIEQTFRGGQDTQDAIQAALGRG
jgi:tRNA-specific 2-thiouridylase